MTAQQALSLLALPHVGPATFARLMRLGSFEAIRAADSAALTDVVGAKAAEGLRDPGVWERACERAQAIVDESERSGTRILCVGNPDYPSALDTIANKPPVLFVKGTLGSVRSVACVGTREWTLFGRRAAVAISRYFASHGWSIVSGLARGIDTFCHWGALHERGHTVAVLGNGLDHVYPRDNESLAAKILDSGGALISEQPFGRAVSAGSLLQRDRIQSGLSIGTIVMQSGMHGGAMQTARYTLLQGRLLAVPVPTEGYRKEKKSQGIIALASCKGQELAEKQRAQGEYAALLRDYFRDRAPAFGITSTEALPELLALLEERAKSIEEVSVPNAVVATEGANRPEGPCGSSSP